MHLRPKPAVATRQREHENRQLLRLAMHLQMKALFEQRLQHEEHRRRRTARARLWIAGGLGGDVESIRVEPPGTANELVLRQRLRCAVRRGDDGPQRAIRHLKAAAGLEEQPRRTGTGGVPLDRRHFKSRTARLGREDRARKSRGGDNKKFSHLEYYARVSSLLTPLYRRPALVQRWFLGRIDHQYSHGRPGWFQFESQLLFEAVKMDGPAAAQKS